MDDISHLCGCANCRALDPHPDSYEKREFSDRHYKFVNAVAAEVRKTHPDRYIGTLIYNIAREIPQTVPRLEDNVFGFITETSALWWQEGRKEADHKITRDWAKRCKHLSRYDYYGMGTFTPRVYPHAMAEQLKFDKSLGLEGMYTEVYTFLPHTAPMIWAFAKLQWDCTLDVDELLGEFCSKMYGQAGPIMKQYFDLLERSWNTPRPGRAGWVHRNLVAQSLAVSPEDVDAGFGLLAKATSAAEGPDLRQRIEIHRAALEYASYVIYAQGISCKLISTAVTDEKSALEALGLVEKLGSLAEGRKKCWAEAPKRDDLLGETLRGLGWKMKYLAIGQVSNVERGGLIGVMKVLGWQSRYPERRISKVEDRLGQLSAGSVGQIVKAWRWMQRTKPKSLLGNGGFEGDAAAGKKPKEDWIVRGAPQGWSSWSRTPAVRYAVLGRKGQDGSAAASIAGADSACYMQTVAARPGQKYLCTCWLRAERPGLDCGGRLSVRFRDGRGGWHARGDLEPSLTMVEGQRDWQPLTLLVEVPDGAASFVVMLGAGNQAKGTSVLFDNAAVYLLP